MVKRIYHPQFKDDLIFLANLFSRSQFKECLGQLEYMIEQIEANKNKSSILRYSPLENFYKQKFFSSSRPKNHERPDMRLIYRWECPDQTLMFLCVGIRIRQKPHHPSDIYQRAKHRDLLVWQ